MNLIFLLMLCILQHLKIMNKYYFQVLNYNYIYALNAWLLICPEWLCFDWSMGCIPLITLGNVIKDARILGVLIFWVIVALLIVTNIKRPPTVKQRCTFTNLHNTINY